MKSISKLDELNDRLKGKAVLESLKVLATLFSGRIVFSTSFGIEDQVITHVIFKGKIPIKVITLDTGRLFPETYKVFEEIMIKYNKKITVYFPDHKDIEKMVTRKGPFSFYESKENRTECCRVRKVLPLKRALHGKSCWVTGIRSEQSDNRSIMGKLEYDQNKKIIKYHPLFDWSLAEVENYIKDNDIPFNSKHNDGYVSIGCEPCTRAIIKGQDFRSGRWWWENDGQKECGCHLK